MFEDRSLSIGDCGWIEVICGCMFSGKTEELLRRAKRAEITGFDVITFKPAIDIRYHHSNVVSHNQSSREAITVSHATDIVNLSHQYSIVCIDEAQFFDQSIVDVCNQLANSGKRVIVAGLDMDFKGRPFGQMPYLMAIAEYVSKLQAICVKSGKSASFSFRITDNDNNIDIGEKDKYEARSRKYFYNQ